MRRLRFRSLGVSVHRPHVHITRMGPASASTPHSHDFYEVFLLLEGSGFHHLNRRRIEVEAGQLVLIQPGDVHWFSTERQQHFSFVNVAVSAQWWRAFRLLCGLPPLMQGPCTVMLKSAETQRLGSELRDLASVENLFVMLQLWKRVQDHLTLPTDANRASAPGWLENLGQQLRTNPDALCEPIAYWQGLAGRSPEHLSRSCRRFYGITFRELINQTRIERAKYLLRTTEKKVITVAFECGYGNMANFYRTFARLSGVTPNAWRLAGNAAVPRNDRGPITLM